MAKYGPKASEKVKKAMHERKNDRHRPVRGAPRRRQGAAQEIVEQKGEKEMTS